MILSEGGEHVICLSPSSDCRWWMVVTLFSL